MPDRYQQLVNTPIGRIVTKQIGLPNPPRLERFQAGQPVVTGPVLLGAAPGGRLAGPLARVLASVGADTSTPMDEPLRTAAAAAKLEAAIFNPEAAPADQRYQALMFDATGIGSSDELVRAWSFFIRLSAGCSPVAA